MKRIIITSLVLSLLVSGSLLARPGKSGKSFRGPDGKHQRDGIRMILRLSDEINLTDEQESQLEELSTNFQIEKIDLQAEIKKAKVELRASMKHDDAAEKSVFQQIDKVSKLKADAQKMRFRHQQTIKNLLTEEQQEKLEDLREDRTGKGRRFGGRGLNRDNDEYEDSDKKIEMKQNKHFGR